MNLRWDVFAASLGTGLLAMLAALVLPAAWSLAVLAVLLDRGPSGLIGWPVPAFLGALAALWRLLALRPSLREALDDSTPLYLALLLVLQLLAAAFSLMTPWLATRPDLLLAAPLIHLPAALLCFATRGWKPLLGALGTLYLFSVPFFAAAVLGTRLLGLDPPESALFLGFALPAVAVLLTIRRHAPVREVSLHWHWLLSLAGSGYAGLVFLGLGRALFQWLGGQGWEKARISLAVVLSALAAWQLLRQHLRRSAPTAHPA